MTTRLSSDEKKTIVFNYMNGASLNTLAACNGRHRSTIVRVLEDAGIDPGIRRRKPKVKLAEITPADLQGFPVLKQDESQLSWIRRTWNALKRAAAQASPVGAYE